VNTTYSTEVATATFQLFSLSLSSTRTTLTSLCYFFFFLSSFLFYFLLCEIKTKIQLLNHCTTTSFGSPLFFFPCTQYKTSDNTDLYCAKLLLLYPRSSVRRDAKCERNPKCLDGCSRSRRSRSLGK
jgi:hypothetical protein